MLQAYTREPETALEGSNREEELTERAQELTDRTDNQFQTYQIVVGTSPTPVAMRPDGFVTIENMGTQDVFLGNTGVSTITGLLLPGTKGKSVKIKTKGDIYAVSSVPTTICVVVGAEVDLSN